ncbi:MBL fold metallo-hydrolase [Asticcacaulis machinosus]|uniref:MBL fold metallo-hydrolase n=1 Tax=Asticcacaulis machinosus TaxID=2984211 RepID=A0ABT5HFU8_9CAUL|nr:MBL fold metallo-hydrolase [Asticcacaulis machinosus]MDC7675139.1 MBL fold metallo-hydrolase [Asticcacaulis machinosus]
MKLPKMITSLPRGLVVLWHRHVRKSKSKIIGIREMMMEYLFFEQSQRPVGQGGFHFGAIHEIARDTTQDVFSADFIFTWAYDCGSNQSDALTREINAVSCSRLDVLFLSHLDKDHVSGVDELLLKAPAKTVVLPYLSDTDWLFYLGRGINDGAISGNFISLVSDPLQWFMDRGTEEIIYMTAASDDDDGPGFEDGPTDPSPSGEGRRDLKAGSAQLEWTRRPTKVAERQIIAEGTSSRIVARQVPARATAAIVVGGNVVNWVLSPFAFRPSKAKMKVFEAKLVQKFGTKSRTEIAGLARSPAGREQLRECYDATLADNNLHSMALYSGPIHPVKTYHLSTAELGSFEGNALNPAWISTGDYDASVAKRRNSLIKYYHRYSSMVGQLCLPHHGATPSFHADLVEAYPNLEHTIVAVGPNTYKHPGVEVEAFIAGKPQIDFIRVDQNPNTGFTTTVMIHG